jgi:WD40 repeat protein
VIRGIGWSPDSQQLISAARDKTIKFWNSSTGRQIGQPCIGHADSIYSLAIASDGSFIATASEDKTVRLWSTKTYQQIGQPLEHPNAVLCVGISTNGALLASGTGGGNSYLWSIGDTPYRQDGQERYEEPGMEQTLGEVVSLQFFLLFHHISRG